MDSNDTAVDPNTTGPDADEDMDMDDDFDEADIEINEDGKHIVSNTVYPR